jgi:hypothetical protein
MPNYVASLVCHAHVDMALACLGSLLASSSTPLSLHIHDDGSLTDADRERLRQGLPDCIVVLPENADDAVLPELARYPECSAFRKKSALARKLLDVPLISTEPFVFCDSDVLWQRPFEGLFELPDATTKVVFMRDHQEAYALRPWNLMGRRAVQVPRRVNTGLMLASPAVLDLDFLEWLLALRLPSFSRFPLWTEQTCWAALGRRAGCRMWDPAQIRVIRNSRCLDQPLVAGHFTSSVRSLMPRMAATTPLEMHGPTVKLKTVVSQSLGLLGLTWGQLSRFYRTRLCPSLILQAVCVDFLAQALHR